MASSETVPSVVDCGSNTNAHIIQISCRQEVNLFSAWHGGKYPSTGPKGTVQRRPTPLDIEAGALGMQHRNLQSVSGHAFEKQAERIKPFELAQPRPDLPALASPKVPVCPKKHNAE
jgi:hypothetical protein